MRAGFKFTVFILLVISAAIGRGQSSEAPFSIVITPHRDAVKAGSEVLLDVEAVNTSDKPIRWFFTKQDLEYDTDVRDSSGTQAQETVYGRKLHRGELLQGSIISSELKPGQQVRGSIVLSDIYDLTKPGEYAVQVMRKDVVSRQVVRSNRIVVRILNSREWSVLNVASTPFSVSIRVLEGGSVKVGSPITLRTCVENNSSSTVSLSNSVTMNRIVVRDAEGKEAPPTESGRVIQKGFGKRGSGRAFPVHPGSDLCGDTSLDVLYDMSHPDKYTIEVHRSLEDAEESGNSANSPTIVKSNQLTLTVTN